MIQACIYINMNNNEILFVKIGMAIADFKKHYHIKGIVYFAIEVKDNVIKITNKDDEQQTQTTYLFNRACNINRNFEFIG